MIPVSQYQLAPNINGGIGLNSSKEKNLKSRQSIQLSPQKQRRNSQTTRVLSSQFSPNKFQMKRDSSPSCFSSIPAIKIAEQSKQALQIQQYSSNQNSNLHVQIASSASFPVVDSKFQNNRAASHQPESQHTNNIINNNEVNSNNNNSSLQSIVHSLLKRSKPKLASGIFINGSFAKKMKTHQQLNLNRRSHNDISEINNHSVSLISQKERATVISQSVGKPSKTTPPSDTSQDTSQQQLQPATPPTSKTKSVDHGNLIEKILAQKELVISQLRQQLLEAKAETAKQRSPYDPPQKSMPEYTTLLDENMFLKKSKQKLEDELAKLHNQLKQIEDWSTINGNFDVLCNYVIVKKQDYKQITGKVAQYDVLTARYNDEREAMLHEKNELESELEAKKYRLEIIYKDKTTTAGVMNKTFKRLWDNIKGEQIELQLDLLRLNGSSSGDMNMWCENMQKAIKNMENELLEQAQQIRNYQFTEELEQIETTANGLLKCHGCKAFIHNAVTHIPCGHSFCENCYDNQNKAAELKKDKNVCLICGKNQKGNWVFKNELLDEQAEFFKRLQIAKNIVLLFISRQ